MNKEDNVFYTLAQQIKNNNNSNNTVQTVNLGKVISVSPLLISVNGIQLDREDLLINKDLLKGNKRKVKINSNNVQQNFNVEDGTIENIEDNLTINSTVLLLTQDNQKFVLLCEVI